MLAIALNFSSSNNIYKRLFPQRFLISTIKLNIFRIKTIILGGWGWGVSDRFRLSINENKDDKIEEVGFMTRKPMRLFRISSLRILSNCGHILEFILYTTAN
jgi:hypothetical protein